MSEEYGWFIKSNMQQIVNEEMSFWGYVFHLLSIKKAKAKWAEEMYDLFNTESVSISVLVDTMEFYDYKHGDSMYSQPTARTWTAYKKWMKDTWGLTYLDN